MASKRDEAFDAFYDKLAYGEGVDPRVVLRKAWESGRQYEVNRIDAITRRRLLDTPAPTGPERGEE